jgi:transposase
MAYSIDLRQRVVAMHLKTGSSAKTAEHYDVCEAWVRRVVQLKRETGSLAPRSSARKDDQRACDDQDEQKIRELIKAKSDATLNEIIEHLGKPVGKSSVARTLQRLKLGRKKSPSMPPSRTAPTSPRSGRHGKNNSPATVPRT